MKKTTWLVVGGSLTLVALGAGIGWHTWSRSPSYALRAVARAVEHHDRYEFEKYVDIDALLQSVVVDVADGNVLATALGGAVTTQLRPQIVKAVEDGTVPPDSRVGQSVQKALSGELPKIERQEKNAYFAIPITTNGGAPFQLKVHMTQVPDGYWRIDRIANMKELRAAEAEEERLRKAAIAKANDDKLAQLRVVARLHTSHAEGWGGWKKKNRFQVRFENASDKTIASMTGRIRVPTAEFDHGIRGTLDVPPGKTENATWDLDVNQFMHDTVRVYAMGESDAFEVAIDTLTYADGTKVQRGWE